MIKTRYTGFAIIIFFLSAFQVKTSYGPEVYDAYISNRMAQWKNVIDRISQIEPKSNDLRLELVNYLYGYTGYCIEFRKEEHIKEYMAYAEENLESLETSNYQPALINAYKCAFYGLKIQLNRLTTPVNGLKSLEYGRKAFELDSNNYFVCLQYGYITFNMPKAFGGSTDDGIKYFIKAKEIIEEKPANLIKNWNYLGLLVTIGQSYIKIEDYYSAKVIFEKILSLEPDFIYVRDDLYPSLLNKMKL